MAELADARDSKSRIRKGCVGSIPSSGTTAPVIVVDTTRAPAAVRCTLTDRFDGAQLAAAVQGTVMTDESAALAWLDLPRTCG